MALKSFKNKWCHATELSADEYMQVFAIIKTSPQSCHSDLPPGVKFESMLAPVYGFIMQYTGEAFLTTSKCG